MWKFLEAVPSNCAILIAMIAILFASGAKASTILSGGSLNNSYSTPTMNVDYDTESYSGSVWLNSNLSIKDGAVTGASVGTYVDYNDPSILHVYENIYGQKGPGIVPSQTAELNQSFTLTTQKLALSQYAQIGTYDNAGKGAMPNGEAVAAVMADIWSHGSLNFSIDGFTPISADAYYNENSYAGEPVGQVDFNSYVNFSLKSNGVVMAADVIHVETAVPEPTSMSLIGLGAFGFLKRRRA